MCCSWHSRLTTVSTSAPALYVTSSLTTTRRHHRGVRAYVISHLTVHHATPGRAGSTSRSDVTVTPRTGDSELRGVGAPAAAHKLGVRTQTALGGGGCRVPRAELAKCLLHARSDGRRLRSTRGSTR